MSEFLGTLLALGSFTVIVALAIGNHRMKKIAAERNEKWRCARCGARLHADELPNKIAVAGGIRSSRVMAMACTRCTRRSSLIDKLTIAVIAAAFFLALLLGE